MENIYRTFEEHQTPKRTHRLTLMVALLVVYVVFIGGAEVFWLFFAGEFSPFVGGLAFMFATLVVARVVGERYAKRDVF